MITKAIEDYLKVIYQIEVERGEVTTSDLADRLSLSPASVTGMLKKLANLDLVSYTRYQGVSLTGEGRAIALRMVRYHRLAERYLAEVLGLPWDEVHAEAEEWEHVISPRVAGSIDAAMGRPTTDPHGEPIPADDGTMPLRAEVALVTLHSGESATIARVQSQDPALLRYLGEVGMYPGVRLLLAQVDPFDGPLTLRIGNRRYSIGRGVAEKVYVTGIEADTVDDVDSKTVANVRQPARDMGEVS